MKKKFFTAMLVILIVLVFIACAGCEPKEKNPTPTPDEGVTSSGDQQQGEDVNPPNGEEQKPDDKEPDNNEPDASEWDDNVDYSTVYLTDGSGVITGMTDYGKTLTHILIPVKLGDEVIKEIGENAFEENEKLERVKFESTNNPITIAEYAFSTCKKLKSVQISAGVDKIEAYAFYYCNALEYISVDENNGTYESCDNCIIVKETKGLNVGCKTSQIPDYVTGIETGAFARQDNIESLHIPSGVKYIEAYAFFYCTALKSVELPENLESIGNYSFNACSKLENINIPKKVESIGSNAFYDCSALESVTFGDDSQLTVIGQYAFKNCIALKGIILPEKLEMIGGLYAGYSFENCISMTKVVIPESVTVVRYAVFQGCTALTIYCEAPSRPDGYVSTSWNDGYFMGNDGIYGKTVKLPTVWDCKNNEVDSDGYINYYTEDNVHYRLKDGKAMLARQLKTLTNLEIESSIIYKGVTYTVTEIGEGACEKLTSLTNVSIPSTVINIGKFAFNGCKELKTVTTQLSTSTNANDSETKEIGISAFEGCESLEGFTIPNSITKINTLAFKECSNLKYIYIPDSVTYISNYVFDYCSSLTSIFIPNSVETVSYSAIRFCASLSVIRCQAMNQPDKWASNWNPDNIDVEWGCSR